MRRTTAPSPSLKALLAALVLAMLAAGCLGSGEGDEDDAAEETSETSSEEEGELEEDAPDAEAPDDDVDEGEEDVAEPTEEPTVEDDPPAPAGDQTEAVVAARDNALAALPGDWTTTPNEPEVGPTAVEAEDGNPLDDCLPPDLQGLEQQVNDLVAVSASGDFSAPATGEEAFGPVSGSVAINSYTDPGAAQDLLTQFGDAVADPAFSECVVEATQGEFGEPPEGSEFDIQVSPGVDGIDSEVALQINVAAAFGGQTVNFDSFFVLASRGSYIVEGQFTGDGENPFPTDLAAAVLDAAG